MASILQVGAAWRALIRRKGHRAICKTFQTKAAAQAWARKIETQLDHGQMATHDNNTIAVLIESYRDLRDKARPIVDTSNEHYMLNHLAADLDQDKRLVGCWRKHPRKGKVWELVPILAEAWPIVQRQDRGDARIFPVHPQTLSKYFKQACDALGIRDLHLHDLRHEGTSRLFEDGMDIPMVALVTGHKDWKNLKRYTNLKPELISLGTRPGRLQRRGSRPSVSHGPRKSSPGKSGR